MQKLFFLLLFMPLFAHAQGSFAPIGAKWHYGYDNKPGLPVVMKSIGNKNIQGRLCRNLLIQEFDIAYSIYVYERNDSVWHFNGANKFELLYDFTAKKGSTWSIIKMITPPNSDLDTVKVTVDSVGYTAHCGDSLKVLYVSYDTARFKWENKIIQCMGNTGFILPRTKKSPGSGPYGLRCYEDPEKSCNYLGFRCDSNWVGIREPKEIAWGFFPNPASDAVTISLPWDISSDVGIQIINLYGQVMTAQPLLSDRQEIPLVRLPNGMYHAVLITENGQMKGKKTLVINRH